MGKGQVSTAQNTATNNQDSTAAATGSFINSQTPGMNSTFNSANSVGSNMAATGGFTPTQSNEFLEEASSGATADYNILSQQAAQQRAKTGGLGSGGEMSQMARQLTQAQDTSTLNAENSLNSQINSNKIAGAGIESNLYSSTLQSIMQAMGLNVQSQGQEDSSLTALATSPTSNKSWWQNAGGALGLIPGYNYLTNNGSGGGGN